MKKVKSVLSIFLAALLLCSATLSVGAVSFWDIYWNDTDEAQLGLIMQPGATEESRNFSWCVSEETTSCSIEISDNIFMLNSSVVPAAVIPDNQGNFFAKTTVTGLEKGEKYYYRCVSGEDKSSIYSFDTVEGDSFSALYMSDIHVTYDKEAASAKTTAYDFADILSEAKTKADINLVLSAGDQATDGLLSEYQGFTFSPVSRGLSIATAVGNHDRKGVAYKYFINVPNEYNGISSSFQGGNYYFVKGDVLFLVINSNNASATDHRNFIENAVKANPDVKWRVVMMHHDMYAATIEHRESENNLLRIIHSPVIDEFNIDLVLTGHSHHYSISDVVYNGKSVTKIENGATVNNAAGTVYMVSASASRPREEENIPYSDLVSIGMENYADKLFNIIDFSHDAITVKTYERGKDGVYASFTLTKDDDYDTPELNIFRKLFSRFAAFIGTVYSLFDNISQCSDLSERGYNVNYFDVVFGK